MSYLGVKKRLGDFPRDEWIQAAGTCGYFDDEDGAECEEKVEVRIGKGEEPDTAWMKIRCAGGHSEEDVVGWKVGDDSVSLGKLGNFFPLLSRANSGYCGSCGRVIVGVPLIVFGPDAPDNVKWEVDFCWLCAGRLNILGMLKS